MSFSNRFGKGLLASLESEEEVVDAVAVVDAEDADNVEAAMGEVAEVETEINATTDAIEQGAQDADALDAIADAVEETEQDGGADPVVAQVAEVAVEAIYKRLGLTTKPIASMEGFGDKATRIEATRLSVEGWRETAAAIWKAIKDLFKRIGASVVQFFKQLFVATERTLKRAEALQTAAENVKGAPKEETVSGSFVRTLADGKTFDKAYAIASVGNIAKYSKDVGTVIKRLSNLDGSMDIPALIADAAAFSEFTGKDLYDDANVLDKQATKLFGLQDDADSVWISTSSVKLGANQVAMKMPLKTIKGAEAMKSFGKMTASIVGRSKDTAEKDAKAPALNKAETLKVIAGVKAGMTAFIASKADINKAVEGIGKVEAAAGDAGKKAGDADSAARGRMVAGAVKGYGRVLAGVSTQATKLAVAVAGAGLDYAQKSIKNMGGEGVAETKEEKAAA